MIRGGRDIAKSFLPNKIRLNKQTKALSLRVREYHLLLAMLLIFIAESHLSAMHLNFVYAQEYVAIKFILVKKQLSSGNLLSFFLFAPVCNRQLLHSHTFILLFFPSLRYRW